MYLKNLLDLAKSLIIVLVPGDKDGSVVMGVMVIIQDVLALLPDAEVF